MAEMLEKQQTMVKERIQKQVAVYSFLLLAVHYSNAFRGLLLCRMRMYFNHGASRSTHAIVISHPSTNCGTQEKVLSKGKKYVRLQPLVLEKMPDKERSELEIKRERSVWMLHYKGDHQVARRPPVIIIIFFLDRFTCTLGRARKSGGIQVRLEVGSFGSDNRHKVAHHYFSSAGKVIELQLHFSSIMLCLVLTSGKSHTAPHWIAGKYQQNISMILSI